MKYKSYIKYFLIFSIILISLLPVYNFYQYVKNYDLKKLFNVDSIEKYLNYSVYKLFNRSMVQEQVITGKDNFLFLGNNYENVLHKTNGIYRPSNEEINNWTNKLKDLQTWYEDRGIKFVIVIAPNKHSIYKEKLPNWMQYDGKTITDDIVEQANLKNINILDLREELTEAKKEDSDILYWKTDTHWNEKGASFGYEEIINKINNFYQLNLKKPTYELIQSTRGSGDLANFLRINTILRKDYEKSYNYSFDNNYDICKGNINKDNHILEKCEKINNPIVQISFQPQYVLNENAENNLKLLFLCDSFGTAPSQLYNATFKEIYKFHWSQINGSELVSFIEDKQPNIVIYQVIERALFNDQIIVAMPTISKLSNNYITSGSEIFDITKDEYYKNNQLEIILRDNKINLNVIKNDPILILNHKKLMSKNLIFSYEIESNIETTFQLFYRIESDTSYNEINSYSEAIHKGNNKFILLVPSKYLNNDLRIDLVSNIGKYEIKKLKIFEVEKNK